MRDKLKASDVALYCIGVNVDINPAADLNYLWNPNEHIEKLAELSTASGGRSFFPKRNQLGPAALSEAFELIALELRAHYQLVIAPEHAAAKARFRRINIEAKQGTERLTARTRLWYYR